ncbi:MAG: box helicase domain protein [Crocinitomicaceae bacterium]|jgi:superfamily II DNA/RNA helicase|nr:box helicase domain protein [Crocinitomicaceae bacterium]
MSLSILSEDFRLKLAKNGIPEISEEQLALLKALKSGQDFLFEAFEPAEIIALNTLYLIDKIQADETELLPRALVFCSDIDTCFELEAIINSLAKFSGLVTLVTHDKGKKIQQRNDLYSGCDIVIGNARRICELYFQNGINLKNLKLISIIDANTIVAGGGLTPIMRLKESIIKCQKLVFYSEDNAKIETLLQDFPVNPRVVSKN